MPLKKGTTNKTANINTSHLIHKGYSPEQAYAISKDVQEKEIAKKRRSKKRRK